MAENRYTPGQVYEIKPLIITPDRAQTFGPGGGGGYSGNGDGWGLQEGPHRGTGSSRTIHEIALPNVMSEFTNEQVNNKKIIDDEYNNRFQTLTSTVERELSEKTQAAKSSKILTPSEAAALDQKIALDLIESKRSQYQSIAPNIYGLYGQSPFFMMDVLPRQKIRELLNSGNANRESFIALYALFDHVHRSALEIKLLSISIKILSDKLSDIASRRDQSESIESLDQASWNVAATERLSTISTERDIHVQRLPEFLQTELTTAAGTTAGLTPAQAMKHYQSTLERMAASKTAAIKPIHAPAPFRSGGVTITFPPENPKIRAPLSKPEVEALNELVYLQTNTAVGTKWLSYHDALLKSESARHLKQIAQAFSGLTTRLENIQRITEAKRAAEEQIAHQIEARRVAQEQAAAQRIAKEAQAAAERAAQAAQAAKAANTFRLSSSAAASQATLLTATGSVTVFEGAEFVLRAAVRSATAAVFEAAAGAASTILVGFAALVYPSELANGELPERYAFGIPLSDLATAPEDDLSDAARTGATVGLDVRISSREIQSGESQLFAVKTDGVVVPSGVKVYEAAYNNDTSEYVVTTADSPPRTLVWTPIVDTGNSSTIFPDERPAAPTYTGAKLKPGTGRVDKFPTTDIWFDDFITVFPVDSGLPPIYTMFRDRREVPGTVTGAGSPVTGPWLGAGSPETGAPIPSQIADKLRGKDYRNFRAFREDFWKTVSEDPKLFEQFSASNRSRIKRGHAPYASSSEHVGGQEKYELHHVTFLKDDGMVYDIDNIRIVTPKQHNTTHHNKPGA